MRAHYDLRDGKSNEYAKRLGARGREAVLDQYLEAAGLVKLDDDVAAAFGSAEAVNEALRIVLRLRELTPRATKKTTPTAKPRRRAAGA
jgi:hypothetical protein